MISSDFFINLNYNSLKRIGITREIYTSIIYIGYDQVADIWKTNLPYHHEMKKG